MNAGSTPGGACTGESAELMSAQGERCRDHVSRSKVNRLYFACDTLSFAAVGNSASTRSPLVTIPRLTSIFVVKGNARDRLRGRPDFVISSHSPSMPASLAA